MQRRQICTPASSSRPMPACSMKATGGLTHFIDGDDRSRTRRRRGARTCRRSAAPRRTPEGGADLGPRQAGVVPRSAAATRAASRASRPARAAGRTGKSKAASHGPGVRSQAENAAKSAWAHDLVEPTRRVAARAAERDRDRLAARRRAGEVDAGELHRDQPSASAPTPAAMQAAPARRSDAVALAEQAAADQRREQHRDLARRRHVADRRQPHRVQHQHVAERPEHGDDQRRPPLRAPDLAKPRRSRSAAGSRNGRRKTLPT